MPRLVMTRLLKRHGRLDLLDMVMATINNFTSFCQRRDIKDSTIALHLRNILKFGTYCWVSNHKRDSRLKGFLEHLTLGAESFASIHKNITPELAYSFIDTFRAKGCKNTYINNYISSIRVLGQFLDIPSLKIIPQLKEENYIKATMDDCEIELFLSLSPPSNTKKETWELWNLFFGCLSYTGARPGEISHLKIDNVDFGRGVFILEDTKTNEPRYVPIPEHLKEKLRERILKVKCGDYLFTTCHNNPFNDGQWNYQFHTRIDRLGIKRLNLTPYSLRHSCITRLLEEDVNIFKVQKLVGHHDINTTLHYTHMTTKDIINALNKDRMVRKYLAPQKLLDAIEEYIDTVLMKNEKINYQKTKSNGKLNINLSLSGECDIASTTSCDQPGREIM